MRQAGLLLAAALAFVGVGACQRADSPPATSQAILSSFVPFPDAASVRMEVVGIGGVRGPGDGRVLTTPERAAFERSLKVEQLPRDKNGDFPARAIVGCFIPHHFFVYSDRQGNDLGKVAICFCCGGMDVIPGRDLSPGQQFKLDYLALEALVKSLGSNPEFAC